MNSPASMGLACFSESERAAIAGRWHALDAWPDFAPALTRLRRNHTVVSFTILSVSLIIDTARRNGLHWDAVISCEMLDVYKPRPEAYQRAAKLLQLAPDEILMVACHNFDLNAARGVGYRTCFVRRPDEWGPAGPPDPVPHPATDLVVDRLRANWPIRWLRDERRLRPRPQLDRRCRARRRAGAGTT